ncbi:prenyltransferase [Thalassotalea sp. G2M2-11]|uniref:prenyltransferase n=1 Tax=Thalassotalea sp. G2M2-11 TaxID=2787627 RepID=UPI0019D2E40C
MQNNIFSIIPAIRPPFLFLAPICVCYGAAIAAFEGQAVNADTLTLALIGAVLALISVNCFNEYQDYQSGLDSNTKRTPFSGGSGLLVKHPALAQRVNRLAYLSLSLTFCIGLYFAYQIGLIIIPVGLLGIAIIYFYTSHLNQSPFACLIAPGLGLGVLIPFGSYFVLTHNVMTQHIILLIIPFLLINNLLLLNQYPDIEADKQAGRRHFPIQFGVNISNWVYAGFSLLAIVFLLIAVLLLGLPKLLLVAIVPMSLSAISLYGMTKLKNNIATQPHYLAFNAIAANLTPIIISVILFHYSPL